MVKSSNHIVPIAPRGRTGVVLVKSNVDKFVLLPADARIPGDDEPKLLSWMMSWTGLYF